MTTYKKLHVHKLSADFAEATGVVEVPLIPPSKGQVRIKNYFAGVNATDINITSGRYFTDGKVPFDIGLESCGIIDAVGEGVDEAKVGQPVLYLGAGGYSEYLYVSDIKSLIPIPELKPQYLAALVTGLTATIGLDCSAGIKPGDKVLITAAAGGTGQTAVQWAKKRGCFVIGTTSTEEKGNFLKSLGCDHVINYRKDDLFEQLKKSYPEGVDVIWETIGGETLLELLTNHLAIHGRCVTVGGITGYKTVGFPGIQTDNLPGMLLMKSQSLIGFFLVNERHRYTEYLPKLISAIQSGELKVKVDNGRGNPFKGIESVARAGDHLHSGKNEGKVYVALHET